MIRHLVKNENTNVIFFTTFYITLYTYIYIYIYIYSIVFCKIIFAGLISMFLFPENNIER